MATRVLIVDDHRMFSELIADVLRGHAGITVTGIASNGAEAVGSVVRDAPDVVVLDYRLPGDDGIAVARRLRQELPGLGIVMLTGMQEDDAVLRAAVVAGCAGFVTKDRSVDELVEAVRSVHAGRRAIDPAAAARLATAPASVAEPHRFDLTGRELEVLRLLAEGFSTRSISEELFISNNTARNHVQRLIAKLGAHSRLEAVATARRTGVLDAVEAR
jgi:DNA-binding NarL/FixJ family response regulator